MINTVIFDIGNVLIDFDWGAYILDLFDKETAIIVKNAIFSDFWNEIDRGVLSDEEMIQGFIKRANGYEKEIRIAFSEVGKALSQRKYAIPWVKELKNKGLRVLYLSNYSTHVMKSKPEALSFTDYMDGGIFSCNVKLIKPDPAIYKTLCDTYQVEKETAVFIDDNAANVKAALDFGLNAIHFVSYKQTYDELLNRLN